MNAPTNTKGDADAQIDRSNALLWLRRVAERPDDHPDFVLKPLGIAATAAQLRLWIELRPEQPHRAPPREGLEWIERVINGGTLDDVAYARSVMRVLGRNPNRGGQ